MRSSASPSVRQHTPLSLTIMGLDCGLNITIGSSWKPRLHTWIKRELCREKKAPEKALESLHYVWSLSLQFRFFSSFPPLSTDLCIKHVHFDISWVGEDLLSSRVQWREYRKAFFVIEDQDINDGRERKLRQRVLRVLLRALTIVSWGIRDSGGNRKNIASTDNVTKII